MVVVKQSIIQSSSQSIDLTVLQSINHRQQGPMVPLINPSFHVNDTDNSIWQAINHSIKHSSNQFNSPAINQSSSTGAYGPLDNSIFSCKQH